MEEALTVDFKSFNEVLQEIVNRPYTDLIICTENVESSTWPDLSLLIEDIDKFIYKDGCISDCVRYQYLCKLAAELCFQKNSPNDGIYFLSETHGAYQRKIYHERLKMNERVTKLKNKNTADCYLNLEYLSAKSSYYNKYEGLRCRLKEMPEEWTIVQITLPFYSHNRWEIRRKHVHSFDGVHIVRFSCGNNNQSPFHVYLPSQTKESEDNILNILYNSVLNKSLHKSRDLKAIKERRLRNCEILKKLIDEGITSDLLQCWRFLLLGKICNSQLEKSLSKSLDEVLNSETTELSNHDKSFIRQLVLGCAHLDEAEIEDVISQVIKEPKLQETLTQHIIRIRNENQSLLFVKRYPVILILDEKLECIPWEMLSVLRNHPVSRMISLHFAHASYKAHANSIVKGNRVVTDVNKGYYIINPDLNLPTTEERIKNFLIERKTDWRGLVGSAPTKAEFCEALADCSILLYCGHGSGAQYLSTTRLDELKLKAIPLLFGCSSVEHVDSGTRVPFACHADSFILSGSPCVLGMLWSVTSKDADEMAVSLINYWFPGDPIAMQALYGNDKTTFLKTNEPELLRAVILARDVAALYFNRCAMVVYGIPTIVQ